MLGVSLLAAPLTAADMSAQEEERMLRALIGVVLPLSMPPMAKAAGDSGLSGSMMPLGHLLMFCFALPSSTLRALCAGTHAAGQQLALVGTHSGTSAAQAGAGRTPSTA
jgi:hypothetical protein